MPPPPDKAPIPPAAQPIRLIYYIGWGCNVGTEPEMIARVRQTLTAVTQIPTAKIIVRSSIYRTPPWGNTEQASFLNGVIKIRCDLNPLDLLRQLKAIEQTQGRQTRERWGPREIDLDILLAETEDGQPVEVQTDALTIPHKNLLSRSFVIVPLLEIEPDGKLPNGKRIAQVAVEAVMADTCIVRVDAEI